jgi:hypothetical protein
MALLELVLQSTFVGQECINRFNYVSSGVPAAVSLSFALTSAFGAIFDTLGNVYPTGTPFNSIRTSQSVGVVYDFISVRDVYSATDFYETPFVQTAAGTVAGDSMSPTQAYGFRSNRVRSDIRRGMKRFVGVTEPNVGSGGNIDVAFMNTALNTLAGRLGEVLTYNDEGNTLTFSPCIVKKFEYTPDPLRPERKAYKYWEDEADQLANIAVGIAWDAYPQVRTQVSRQYGRGR